MSEASIDKAGIDKADAGKRGMGEAGMPGPPAWPGAQMAAAMVLALLSAIAAGALAYALRGGLAAGAFAGLGLLAAVGLFSLFAAIAGLIAPLRKSAGSGLSAAILEKLEDACVATDKSGRVVYANAAYIALAGSGVTVESLYAGHPEIAEHIYRLVRAAGDGEAHVEQVRLIAGSAAAGARPDRPAWLKIQAQPLQGAGKALTLWRLRDVTDDHLAQESAFAELQNVIDYLDHAPAGFFSTDGAGRVEYVNATLAGWLGLDLSATTGGNLDLKEIAGKEGAQLLMNLDARPGSSAEIERFDLTLKGAGGKGLHVQVLHRAAFDAAGKPTSTQSLVVDRGAISGAEVRGGKVEVRFARFFNDAPIGIVLLNGKGEIVNANPAFVRIAGKTARKGRPLESFISEAGHGELNRLLDQAGADAPHDPVDVTFAGRDDAPGQIFLSALEDAGDDDDARIIAYALDRSEQKALEQQFTQSQKMQAVGQLAGGVAHDFNNVLTAIIGFSDLLLARHRPTDPSFQDIMNIKQNANRAANLVRQLLAFSRQQTLRPEVLSLADVLADLGNLLSRLLGAKVELGTDHARGLWPIKADLNQFEQVVINLAVNARDAMPDGGVLTIRTENITEAASKKVSHDVMPAADYVLCEVSDTGTGMAREVVEKIYEPFFSTKEVGKGTGLGLSTVYGIVKQTGGFIFCDSTIGAGTHFQIYIPRHIPVAKTAEEIAAEDAAREPVRADLTGAGTILLVEDEEAVRAFAARALSSRGYTVFEAVSGTHALKVLDEEKPELDLVISDVVMPEMDGPALLDELRKRKITTKVIFISGYAEDTFRKTLAENEDIAFLPKPFSLKQLAAAVKDAMTG